MLSVSNLMILWLEVDSVEDLAGFGSAGANSGACGESDLTVAPKLRSSVHDIRTRFCAESANEIKIKFSNKIGYNSKNLP